MGCTRRGEGEAHFAVTDEVEEHCPFPFCPKGASEWMLCLGSFALATAVEATGESEEKHPQGEQV